MDDLFRLQKVALRGDSDIRRVLYAHHNSGTLRHRVGTRTGGAVAIVLLSSDQTRESEALAIREVQRPYIFPCQTNPHHTMSDHVPPRRTSPYHDHAATTKVFTLPYPTRPNRTSPHLIRPDLAGPYHTAPCQTVTAKVLTIPYPTRPHRTDPDLTWTGLYLASPNPTFTTNLLAHLKSYHSKAAKLGAEVANADCLACQGENILYDFGRDLVINDANLKGQLPTWLERGAQSHDAGALHDDRAHVQVEWLIPIAVQFIRHFDAVQNEFGLDKDVCRKQVFVGLASLALDFEPGGSLGHAALEVAGRLVDFAVGGMIEILSPFLGVVGCTRLLVTTLGHRRQIWHGKTMLHQGGNAFYLTIDSVHRILLTLQQRTAALRLPGFLSEIIRRSQSDGPLLANKNARLSLTGTV